MKNTYKTISGLLLLSIGFFSCSTDTEEAPALSALDQELSMENKGFLEIESSTYIFKNSGETVKFIEQNKDFEFKFSNGLIYTTEKNSSKHPGENLIITNPETNEYIIISHFHDLKEGRLEFDAELSNGKKYRSLVYNSGSLNNQKWHDPDNPPLAPEVFEALIVSSQDDPNGQCKAAIQACTRTGGTATVTVNTDHGWFNTPAPCQVGCSN